MKNEMSRRSFLKGVSAAAGMADVKDSTTASMIAVNFLYRFKFVFIEFSSIILSVPYYHNAKAKIPCATQIDTVLFIFNILVQITILINLLLQSRMSQSLAIMVIL